MPPAVHRNAGRDRRRLHDRSGHPGQVVVRRSAPRRGRGGRRKPRPGPLGRRHISTSSMQLYTHLHTHPELSYQERRDRPANGRRAGEGRGGGHLERRPARRRRRSEERPGPGRPGPHRHGRFAGPRGDRPPLRQPPDGHRPVRSLGLGDARLRPRYAHDLLHRHRAVAGGSPGPRGRARWSSSASRPRRPSDGARVMLNDGLYTRFPKPDFALALHCTADQPTGTVHYCPGPMLASSTSVSITIRGKGGHGAWPHRTVDPIVLASLVVVDLQTIVSREIEPSQPAVLTVGLDPRGHQAQHHSQRGQAPAHAAGVLRAGPLAAP